MRTLARITTSLLLLAIACAAQSGRSFFHMQNVASVGTGPVSQVSEFSGTGTGTTASATGAIAGGPNNVVVIRSRVTGGPWAIDLVSAGLGGTMKKCGPMTGASFTGGFVDCVYIEAPNAFAGPVVVTYRGSNTQNTIVVTELTSSTPVKLDSFADFAATSSSLTFARPSITASCSSCAVLDWGGSDTTVTAASGSFSGTRTNVNNWGFAEVIGTNSGAGPTWTVTATPQYNSGGSVIFGVGGSECSPAAVFDGSGGVDAAAPTNATMDAATFGKAGYSTVGQTDSAGWDTSTNASGMVFSTAARKALPSVRLCSRGTSYTDTSSVGLRYNTAVGPNKYMRYRFPQFLNFTGQTSPKVTSFGAWFRTSFTPSDTFNVDLFTLYAGGGGGTIFQNIYLQTNGVNVLLGSEGSGAAAIPITSNTWYWVTGSYVRNPTGKPQVTDPGPPVVIGCNDDPTDCSRFRVYDENGVQVGSEIVTAGASGAAHSFAIGNSLSFALTTGRTMDIGGFAVCYTGSCPLYFTPWSGLR